MEYEQLVREYLDYLKTLNYAQGTIRNKKKAFNAFEKFLKIKKVYPKGISFVKEELRPLNSAISDVRNITRSIVLAYLEEVQTSKATPETKAYKLITIKLLIEFLNDRTELLINPFEGVTLPKKRTILPKTILTIEEITKLLHVPNTSMPEGIRDRALLELMYSTGIRHSEITHLTTEDVDLRKGTVLIRQGKGRKDRIVPIGKTALNWVRLYLKRVRPRFIGKRSLSLFTSVNGEPLSGYWVTTTLKECVYQAKIKKRVTPHTIRHTMASHLVLKGADITVVQRILGHERLETTTIYTRVFPTDLKKTHQKTHPREKGHGNRETNTRIRKPP